MPESWEDDLCGRCLAIMDSRTAIQAWGKSDQPPEDCPHPPTAARQVRAWVEEKLYGDRKMISVDDRPNAFRPISSWHGDAVCEWHLRECRERELRNAR